MPEGIGYTEDGRPKSKKRIPGRATALATMERSNEGRKKKKKNKGKAQGTTERQKRAAAKAKRMASPEFPATMGMTPEEARAFFSRRRVGLGTP